MKNHLRVVWAAFALLVASCTPAPALAAEIFKSVGTNGQPMSLTLKDTPCSDVVVLKHLAGNVRPEFLDKFKNARLYWAGKEWASCWLELDGVVYSLDEEGTPLQPIPRSAFRDDAV